MGRDVPWKLGFLKPTPVGLRERVLRIWFMTPQEVRRVAADSRDIGMRNVANWRREESPHWRELVELVGVQHDDPKSAPRRRARVRVDMKSLARTA